LRFFVVAYLLQILSTDTCIASRTGNSLVWCTGFLGNKQIPLPACAYTKIRKQFPAAEEETFTGFDLDEEH